MRQALTDSRFRQLWVQVHSSLWFVPALLITGMMLLALGLVEADQHVDGTLRKDWPRLFAIEAEGARSMLSTIAGSMATIAGVTFSITMVALTLASAQYTSRVLRNFMRDRVNQSVLGIFVGIFLYCLLVLRAIREQQEPFVPACAVLGALLLSVVAGAAFIYFIHHISSTIQASDMAQAIARETLHMVDKYFPHQAGDARQQAVPPHLDALRWHPVPTRQWGTIQTVTEERLVEWACAHDAVVRMEHKPGDFLGMDERLLSVAMDHAPDEDTIAELNGAFGIDAFRTLDQDPAFGIRQLVDMALKALSPGINDSTTAVTCLEHIGVILVHCARRDLRPRHRYDDRGALRVLSLGLDFPHLVSLAFRQIAESAHGNTEVMLRALDMLYKTGIASASAAQLRAVREQAEVLGEIALDGARSRAAKEQIAGRLRLVRTLPAQPATPAHDGQVLDVPGREGPA